MVALDKMTGETVWQSPSAEGDAAGYATPTLVEYEGKRLIFTFTGKITNWKRVNGPNRRIIVVWNPSAATENEPFIHSVLLGEPVVATYHSAVNDEDVRKKVMETPGAIGIGPYGLIAPVVRVPKSPSVSSTVVFITRGKPSPQVQNLIDLIKDVAFIP